MPPNNTYTVPTDNTYTVTWYHDPTARYTYNTKTGWTDTYTTNYNTWVIVPEQDEYDKDSLLAILHLAND